MKGFMTKNRFQSDGPVKPPSGQFAGFGNKMTFKLPDDISNKPQMKFAPPSNLPSFKLPQPNEEGRSNTNDSQNDSTVSEKKVEQDFLRKPEQSSQKIEPPTSFFTKSSFGSRPKPKYTFSESSRPRSKPRDSLRSRRSVNWEALTGRSRESRERSILRDVKSAVLRAFRDDVTPEEAQEIAESLSVVIRLQSEKLAESVVSKNPDRRISSSPRRRVPPRSPYNSRPVQRPPPGMIQVPAQQWDQMLQMSFAREAQFNMLMQSNAQLMQRIQKLRNGDDEDEYELEEEEEEEEEEVLEEEEEEEEEEE